MIINRIRFLKKCVFLADVIIISFILPIAVSFYKCFEKIDPLNFILKNIDWNIFNYSTILICVIPIWYITLNNFRAYHFFRKEFIKDVINSVIYSTVIVLIVLSLLIIYLAGSINFKGFKIYEIEINFKIILIYTFICGVILTISRICLISIFRIFQKFGYNKRQILIVGTGPRAQKHFEKILNHSEWGFNILGFVALENNETLPLELNNFKILGFLDDIDRLIKEFHVDEIFFIVPRQWLDKIENAVMVCDLQGITVHIAVDLFSIKISKTSISTYYKIPVLSLNSVSINYPALSLKRLIDIILSLLGIIIFSPFALLIAIVIKLESKGSVFFVQKRSGIHGKIFPMLKFRTMINNAENLLNDLKSKNEQDGPVFKMKCDPRVTKFGRLLRKSSLDEMPQLVNVLLGHMSLVGPRPPIISEVEMYEPWQRRRLSMRPGITCIWQVSGRNDVNFERWMEMDLDYIDHWSLGLDFKLLLKTIPYVIIAKGNHS